jgi:DNA-directed RNA polymerase subunit omega
LNSGIGNVDSKFRFIILAAMRTRQLQGGARPNITPASKKFTRIAMEELTQGAVKYEVFTEELAKKKGKVKE